MPFEQIGRELEQLIAGASALMNSPDIKQVLQRMPELSAQLQEMMGRTNKLIVSTEAAYGANSAFRRDTDRMMVQLNDMIQSVRVLADTLSRHPEALVRGRPDRGSERWARSAGATCSLC